VVNLVLRFGEFSNRRCFDKRDFHALPNSPRDLYWRTAHRFVVMETRMKILMAASEMEPLARTGGLGDVLRALPLELAKRGHEVSVALPFYRSIRENRSLKNKEHRRRDDRASRRQAARRGDSHVRRAKRRAGFSRAAR
jgi:hypothetical protein